MRPQMHLGLGLSALLTDLLVFLTCGLGSAGISFWHVIVENIMKGNKRKYYERKKCMWLD